MAEIVLDNIVKRYANGFEAVKGLSLTIAEGELLVLVGPSGCGKTTALRMIAGLEDITDGDLYIDGRRMNDVLERDRDIAMVFQSYALYPHMTVAQNIAFSLRLGKRPKQEIRERVKETATLLGLENLLDRRPKQLSGGQRQRVAMGRAIIRQPRVFLMDEPLSNLDAQLRVQMRGEIEALQKRLGVTTVYVTHDQVEALTMGDRIAVMREGLLQQIGGPTEVYDRPANLFVAGFIGSPPMNLAQATLDVGDGGTVVHLGSAALPVPAEIAREQGLDAWIGRRVVVGIRPEDLHGSGDGPESGATLRAEVDRVESVGASLLVHFSVDAEPARSAGLAAATGGEHLEEVPLTGRTGTSFCASFEPRSGIRAGDTVDVRVDTRRLHFFDPETEASLHAALEMA
ncbi:MAG: Carbohydrate transporter ATP-binding protein family [Actinomycetia bacterium]|nr:Carbohydrate transporter ATP-binding protein family [Actinomycetes bacterium]